MPYKDPEMRKAAARRSREKAAEKNGRTLCPTAGPQRSIPRCAKCPESGGPCRDCYNAHRRTYRIQSAGYYKKYVPRPNQKPRIRVKKTTQKQVEPKKRKPYKHKIAVQVQPVPEFLRDDLFGCPGCMRKLRGAWRYCDRCEARKSAATKPT